MVVIICIKMVNHINVMFVLEFKHTVMAGTSFAQTSGGRMSVCGSGAVAVHLTTESQKTVFNATPLSAKLALNPLSFFF